jgi:hypothetical protein
VKVPTLRRARAIWRDAIAARAAQLGPACPPRLLDWLDAAMLEHPDPTEAREPRAVSKKKQARSKREWRARPGNRDRENARAAELRRAKGIPTREERNAALRAQSEARREEREAAMRAKRRTPEARAKSREKQARRMASMSPEERRAEWNRYQRAKRARDAQRRQEAP